MNASARRPRTKADAATANAEELITQVELQVLARTQVIREAIALPSPHGWTLRVRVGSTEQTLKMRDEKRPRYFQTLDAIARMAHRLGLHRFSVDDLQRWQV